MEVMVSVPEHKYFTKVGLWHGLHTHMSRGEERGRKGKLCLLCLLLDFLYLTWCPAEASEACVFAPSPAEVGGEGQREMGKALAPQAGSMVCIICCQYKPTANNNTQWFPFSPLASQEPWGSWWPRGTSESLCTLELSPEVVQCMHHPLLRSVPKSFPTTVLGKVSIYIPLSAEQLLSWFL